MKIDLHLHSYASKINGDSIQWSSVYQTVKQIYNNSVKLASFTDHNFFDIELFINAKKLGLTGGIIFLPGIEVNVIRKNGTIAHMLILFKENLNDVELNEIKKISKEQISKNGINLNKINELFSSFETIRIIHIGKSDFFSFEDLENLNYDAFEITNFNHPNYVSISKKKEYLMSSIVAFSDTHMWDNYPQQKLLETWINLKEPSFQCLKEKLNEKNIYCKNRIAKPI